MTPRSSASGVSSPQNHRPNQVGRQGGGSLCQVGYKKPPLATRFQQGGPSPNPKGRPRGSKKFSTLLRQAVNKKVVVVTENGQRRQITKAEAAAAQLANGMARGELKTTQYVVGITEESERSAAASAECGSFIIGF